MMEVKLIPFKFNFTNNVIQRISEMNKIENGEYEEMLTPEVTIEKIKLPRREVNFRETSHIEIKQEICTDAFDENEALLQAEIKQEYFPDFIPMEEGVSSIMPEFVSHFLLDVGVPNISPDLESLTKPRRSRDIAFTCPLCDHITFRRESLKIHIRQTHGNYKPFCCPLCSYCSSERKMLRRHVLAVHERHKPHKCPECDYSASLNSNLKKHIENVHRKNKPHKCSECSYSSSEKGKLRRHIDSVHRNSRPFNCQFCSYSASREATLKSHVWSMHSGCERLFDINQCSTDNQNIIDIKPKHGSRYQILKCTRCTINFSSQRHLTRHLESAHNFTKKKVLKCSECSKFYRDKRSLKIHILSIHLQERPYQCHLCSYNTVDSRYLNRHLFNVHMKLKK